MFCLDEVMQHRAIIKFGRFPAPSAHFSPSRICHLPLLGISNMAAHVFVLETASPVPAPTSLKARRLEPAPCAPEADPFTPAAPAHAPTCTSQPASAAPTTAPAAPAAASGPRPPRYMLPLIALYGPPSARAAAKASAQLVAAAPSGLSPAAVHAGLVQASPLR
eukprot:m.247064 g.247064  ORF g.247064 m.247064 type:complete len:164 (+) comp15276_c0_seq1:43-534(+)